MFYKLAFEIFDAILALKQKLVINLTHKTRQFRANTQSALFGHSLVFSLFYKVWSLSKKKKNCNLDL